MHNKTLGKALNENDMHMDRDHKAERQLSYDFMENTCLMTRFVTFRKTKNFLKEMFFLPNNQKIHL